MEPDIFPRDLFRGYNVLRQGDAANSASFLQSATLLLGVSATLQAPLIIVI